MAVGERLRIFGVNPEGSLWNGLIGLIYSIF
jgi:hypothetical protein